VAGVYADTTALDTPVSIQIEQVGYDEALIQKQSEIDRYIFEENKKNFEDKGITVTNTGIISDYVEVGITPFNEENANYIYELFGKDSVKVVEGIQATTLASVDIAQDAVVQYPSEITEAQIVSAPAEKEASSIASLFAAIWEWIKNIF